MELSKRLREIGLLTDEQAQACLVTILGEREKADEGFRELLKSPEVLDKYLIDGGESVVGQLRADMLNRKLPTSSYVRTILVNMAEESELANALDDWLANKRATLCDPITYTLVAAGLFLVLGSHIKVKYIDGKLSVEYDKKPTTAEDIKRILGKSISLK